MRLGAFLLYNEYTVSRQQQVGRSTCRVHPCKQEKTGSASACAVANPSSCQPLGPSLPATPVVLPGRFRNWKLASTTRYRGHTHAHTQRHTHTQRHRKTHTHYSSLQPQDNRSVPLYGAQATGRSRRAHK